MNAFVFLSLRRHLLLSALMAGLLAGCASSTSSRSSSATAAASARGLARSTSVEDRFTPAGPSAVVTSTVNDDKGHPLYRLWFPANYAALGFKSPIVTWGNGTGNTPEDYSTAGHYTTLFSHLASYGFTVIAFTHKDTGTGNGIGAAALYLVKQNTTAGSVFKGHLDTIRVAAIGHSQGAGGAVGAALKNPSLIKTVMTFSLPDKSKAAANSDCATAADCTHDVAKLTQPVFFTSTTGFWDFFIASPSTEHAYFNSVKPHAALGIIAKSDGQNADHASIQDAGKGGNPGGFLGYATAWLEWQLRGDAIAAQAFTGPAPELLGNSRWSDKAVK